MAKQIAELALAGAVDNADLFWLEQSGLPKRLPFSALVTALGSLPTGTVTNASLRWSGSAWVEETDVRISTGGQVSSTNIFRAGGHVPTTSLITSEITGTTGVVLRVGTAAGGWARGFAPTKVSDSLRLGGFGYLGSNESLSSFHVGFGADWWAGDAVMSISAAGLTTLDAGATGQTLQCDGGGVGADIASFRRNQGASADAEVSINGSSGYPTIRFDRDLATVEWAIGVANNDSFVVANDSLLSTTDNWRLEIFDATMVFNRRANAMSILRVGENTTSRGNSADGALELYGENASTIYGGRFQTISANMQLVGVGGNPITGFQFNVNAQILDGKAFTINSLGDDKNMQLTHNDVDGIITTSSGGINLNSSANYVKIGSDTTGHLQSLTGGFGSVECDGDEGSATWEGYNIAGRAVFMWNNATERGGIYDDVNNRWVFQWNSAGAGSNEQLDLHAGAGIEAKTIVHTVSGAMSGLDIKDASGDLRSAGMATMVEVPFSSNTIVVKEHWAQKALVQTGATLRTLTFNTLTTVPNGAVMWVKGEGGGVTLVDGTMVLTWYNGEAGTLPTGNRSLAKGGWATIHKTGNSTADVTGIGIT